MVTNVPSRGQRITAQTRALRYDGGALSLNAVATVARRTSLRVERLTTPEVLAEWFEQVDLPVATVDTALLERVRALREAMHEVLRAVMSGRAPAGEAVELVNFCAASAVPALVLRATDTGVEVMRFQAPVSPDTAIAAIARDLIGHLRDGAWVSMLRACSAEDCAIIYLDTSQGHRRRWCSMERCGNRVKAARYRARQSRP